MDRDGLAPGSGGSSEKPAALILLHICQTLPEPGQPVEEILRSDH